MWADYKSARADKRSSNANSIPGMTYYNPIVIESNFHNSHNRVQDWIKYTK